VQCHVFVNYLTEEAPGRMRPEQASNGLFPWKRDDDYLVKQCKEKGLNNSFQNILLEVPVSLPLLSLQWIIIVIYNYHHRFTSSFLFFVPFFINFRLLVGVVLVLADFLVCNRTHAIYLPGCVRVSRVVGKGYRIDGREERDTGEGPLAGFYYGTESSGSLKL
jgi:hypothetical protein